MSEIVIINGVEYVPKTEQPDIEIIPHKAVKLSARMDGGWIDDLADSPNFPGGLVLRGCNLAGVLQAGKYKEISLVFETWEFLEE